MQRRQTGRALGRGRGGPAALLVLLAALAILGSLLVVAGTDSAAHAQDTPAEDEPAEEAPVEEEPPGDTPTEEEPTEDAPTEEEPTEDAPTEEEPTEDAPTEDGSAEGVTEDQSTEADDPPAEGALAEEVPADDATAHEPATAAKEPPKGPHSVTSGHYGCTQRPPSRYHDDVPSWSVWCLDPDYWIVEVTCGPAFADAGRTVRFDADPSVVPDLLIYDVCGNLDPLRECPPPSPAAPQSRAPANRGEQFTVPSAEFAEALEEVVSPDELVDTAADALGVTGTGGDPDGTIDASLEPDEASESGIAPGSTADDVGAPGEPGDTAGAADARCGPVWSPGSWYQYEREDPVTGEITAGGRLTGSWIGPRDHEAADAPSFVVRCGAGQLDVVVHTGGAVVAAYGHGIPVDYRLGDTVRSEEWNELDTPGSRRAGVLMPRWFTAGFVELLAANPAGDLILRVFGYDGAELGTATFDLAAIETMMAPVRDICPRPAESTPADES